MAQNTKVTADHAAPPITHILAEFVSGHASRGWDGGVENEAHRTLLNWVGCAIGALQHATIEAALAAAQDWRRPLRDRIKARADDAIREDSVDISVTCRNGRTMHLFVEHAIGSMERPMSDADLHAEFHSLVEPVLGAARAGELIEQCGRIAKIGDLRGLTALARG